VKTIRRVNYKIAGQSAKHVMCVFSAAVLLGEFWAIPVWMRVGYAAALLGAWILVYKIETVVGAWMESRRTRTNRPQPRGPIFPPTAPVLPPAMDSDSAIDAEESAIYALMQLGHSRGAAKSAMRKLERARKAEVAESSEAQWIVDLENHSSRARA
jgi:hypothetical protein